MNILDNIKLSYEYIGFDTRKTMTKMNDYKVTLKYNKKQLTVKYSIGTALTEKHINVKSVMYSLLLDGDCASYNFNDFCDNYGYDNDSIKALKIYNECINTSKKLHNMFSENELKELQELLQDY